MVASNSPTKAITPIQPIVLTMAFNNKPRIFIEFMFFKIRRDIKLLFCLVFGTFVENN
jgi:hypothetical protein